MDQTRSNIISFADRRSLLKPTPKEEIKNVVDKINYVERLKVDMDYKMKRIVEEVDTHEARLESLEAHILQLTKYVKLLAEEVDSKNQKTT